MRKILSVAIIAAFLLPALPVAADPPPWAPAHGRRAKDAERDYRDDHDRDYDRNRDRFYYREDHRHHERRLVRYDEVIYHGDDGRYYCHRSDGTTGLIVGAVAGGVIVKGPDGQPIGAVGVTGDTSDNDEVAALAGIAAAGLTPL